jgi:hypothetical protein
MSSQVKLLTTKLTVLSASKNLLPIFSHGIVSIITGVWEEKYISQQEKVLDQLGKDRNENLSKDNSNDSDTESDTASIDNDHSVISDDNENYLFTESGNRSSNALYSEGLSSGLSSYGSSMSIITPVPRERHSSSKFHARKGSAHDNTNIDFSASERIFSQNKIQKKLKQLKAYFSITVTPSEISIVCPTEVVDLIFGDQVKNTNVAVTILNNFIAVQVDDFDTRGLINLLRKDGHKVMFIPSHFSDYIIIPLAARHCVKKYLKSLNFQFYLDSECYIQSSIIEDWMFVLQNQNDNGNEGLGNECSKHGLPLPEVFGPLELDIPQLCSNKHFAIPESTILVLTGHQLHEIPEDTNHVLEVIKMLMRFPEYLLISLTNSTELSFMVDSELLEGSEANIWVKGHAYLRPVKVSNMVKGISMYLNGNPIGMSTMKEMWVLLDADPEKN